MGAQESPGSSCLSEYLPPSPPPPGPPLSLTQPGRPPPPEPGATVSLVALTQFVGPRGRTWTQCLPRRSSPVCPAGGRACALTPSSGLSMNWASKILTSRLVLSLLSRGLILFQSPVCTQVPVKPRCSHCAEPPLRPGFTSPPTAGTPLSEPDSSASHPHLHQHQQPAASIRAGRQRVLTYLTRRAGIGRPWAVAEPPSGAGGPDCPPACPVSRGRGGEGEQSWVWRCSRSCPGGRPRRDHGSWETQD